MGSGRTWERGDEKKHVRRMTKSTQIIGKEIVILMI